MDAFEIISFTREEIENNSDHLESGDIHKIYAIADKCCVGLLDLKEAKEDIKKLVNISWLNYHSV